MKGSVVQLLPDAHRELQELLPWHASGALDAADALRVEQHLAGCAQCRDEMAFEQRLLALAGAEPSPADADAIEQGLARVRRRIDDEAATRQPPPRRDAATGMHMRPGTWWRWLVAAQFAAIVGLSAALLWTAPRSADYRALAGPAAVPDAANAQLVVRFRPDATEREMRAALAAASARLVNGPTATDAYLLAVPAGKLPDAVAYLRAHPAVTLAESLEAGSR